MTVAWDQRHAAEQERVRDHLLAEWLPTVLAAAPRWRLAADRLGLGPDRARDLAALRRLPSVRETDLLDGGSGAAVIAPTENQVKAHAPASTVRKLAAAIGARGPDGKRDVLLHEYRPLQLQRAGSTGELLIASSRSDLDRMHRAGARTAAVVGLTDQDVVVSAVHCGPTLAHLGIVHLAMGACLTAVHPRTRADFDEVVAAVRTVVPTVLVAMADEVAALARALLAAHAVPTELRRVLVVGPPPTTEAREQMAGVFAEAGVTVGVRALWAPAESRLLWAECTAGSGLHTYPDLEYLETVDPFTGAPTDGDGELTMTSLGWHGTALVRYRTGALVEPLSTVACPDCGRTLPRLVGQLEPAAWQLPYASTDAAGTVDLRGIAAVLGRQPGVVDWRVELLRGPDGDHLRVEVAGDVATDVYELQDELTQACGMIPEVELGVPADEVAAAVERVGGVFADLR